MWPTVRPSTTTYKQYIHELDTRKYVITSLEDLGSASPTNCYWTMISDDDLEFQILVVPFKGENITSSDRQTYFIHVVYIAHFKHVDANKKA